MSTAIDTTNLKPRALNEQNAAAWLAVPVSQLRSWRQRGDGPPYRKYGKHVRYTVADLEEYDRACTRCSTSKGAEA